MQGLNPLNKSNTLEEWNTSTIQSSWEGGSTSFILHLADTNLILAQRNSEWCAHGPILEQDIAITNITLDLIGQSRNFYQYAARQINKSKSLNSTPVNEDMLAYWRTERDYKNLLIAELPIGDWALTILRQFFFSVYQFTLYDQLHKGKDLQLAAIAEKSLKEITYHIRWSSDWVIRLGDGTGESHQRMLNAIDILWPYTGEFFIPADYDAGIIDFISLKQIWFSKIKNVLDEATIPLNASQNPTLDDGMSIFMQTGGKYGIHTEHLGFILSDLQYMQRTYPGAEW